jgi:2-amino-4-hydroxy-6-hydroxymethyldihydropteridine diphosphokinase
LEAIIAYIGLGSNLGRRRENLKRAAGLLLLPPVEENQTHAPEGPYIPHREGTAFVQPLRSSSIYQTAPWGYHDQPDFLNCVLAVQTSLPPIRLLEWVKRLEQEMGREPSRQYGPRVIDVDILLYGGLIVDRAGLQIPHPRLHQRAFVLVPLAELASGLVHPTLGLPMDRLARGVEGKDGVNLWGPPLDLGSRRRRAAAG